MASAPTREIGQVTPFSSIPGWGGLATFVDENETVPELRWNPSGYGAVDTYEQMRADSQVHALYTALTLPIRRYRWQIDPNGARDQIVEALSEDLGLPILGQEAEFQGRTRNRFSWDQHLHHVLLALVYGHMFFEQVGEIVDGRWRLRKLAPRLPKSISEIKVADDGGLVFIKQDIANQPEIPVDRLVAYVWQQEAGNWVGRSLLRPLYRHWLVKDLLIRVDAIKHERNGMGVPVTRVTERDADITGQSAADAQEVASRLRAGDDSGAHLPYGIDLKLQGVDGSLPDTLGSIRYHDEAMARALLAMFMQLGQTQTGSRALGESQLDFFGLAQQSVATWIAGVTNEHVVEDWVDWNYGETENPVPLITFEPDEDPRESVSTLLQAIETGAVSVDSSLENWLRDQLKAPQKDVEEAPSGKSFAYDLDYKILTIDERRAQLGLPPLPNGAGEGFATPPEITTEDPDAAPPQEPVAATRRPVPRRPVATATRDQAEHEAHVDFDKLQAAWLAAVDEIVGDWGDVQAEQIDELAAAMAATGGLEELSRLQATPAGADVLAARMLALAEIAAVDAVAEAVAQGATVEAPELTIEDFRERADAVSNLLARSISETAGRQAIQRTGGSLTPTEVAAQVREHLEGLTDAYLRDQLGGALTQAQSTGRREVMRREPPVRIYASALLDPNACEVCADTDGKEYATVEEAEVDFPTGGNAGCLGGPRCRCTLVAVYEEADAA